MRSLNWISAKSLMSAQHEWEIWLRSNKEMDFINQDPLTHWVFVFIVWCFFQYISSRIVYFFYLKYYELFFYSKSRRSPIKAIKTFHITAPWNHNKHPLLWDNGYVMLSKQLGDITMGRWCCHWYQTIMWPTAWIFYTRSRNTWILYSRSR